MKETRSSLGRWFLNRKLSAVFVAKESEGRNDSMESMPAANQVGETAGSSAASAVIRAEELHKYYDLGETRVHALRGGKPGDRARRVRSDHGGERKRQVDLHERPRLDRPSSGRYLLEGIDVSLHDKKALALIRNQKIGFVSKASICWRGPRT